jgi:tetratricopeptide (TPR) repeat protein
VRGAAQSATLHVVLILACALGAGARTIGHDFVFDDHMLLGGNAPLIRGEAPLGSAFTERYWGAGDEASPNELYRPVTVISLGLNARLLGGRPADMHAVNVALHALNACLLCLLLGALFSRPVVALAASLLFALHPIATEAVAAVSGRADLLATGFILVACLLGLAASRRRGVWILIGGLGVAGATFLGALSKETAFVAPLLMVAVLGADARRHDGPRRSYRDYLMTAGTLAGIQAFVLLMALLLRVRLLGYLFRLAPPDSASSAYLAFVNNPLTTAEPLARIFTALRVAVRGAWLLIWPARLSADYSFDQIPVSASTPGAADLAALGFAAAYLGLVIWSARRFPMAMFALSWSAVSYLMVSNLIFPIGTIFGERLLYLPAIGFCLLLAAGLAQMARRSQTARRAATGLALAILALYGARFVARCGDWASDTTLFAATVRDSPRSAKAHSNRGFTLQMAGNAAGAIESYHRALSIAPGMTGTRMSLASLLLHTGAPGESVDQFRLVVTQDPAISVAWSGLGTAQEALDQIEEAGASYRKALDLSLGRNREALAGTARIRARTGQEEEAVSLLESMLRSEPSNAALKSDLAHAHYLLGVRRLREERREEFRAAMRRAVELDPSEGSAHYNLALDALESGDVAAARAHALDGLKSGYEFPAGFLAACGLPEPRQLP